MSRYRKITTICCAAVFALGLAACGGGGDDGLNTSQEQELQDQKKAAEEQVATLQGQINALRAQLGLDPADDLGDSVESLQMEVSRLQKEIQDAKDAADAAADEKMQMEMAAAGKALKSALGRTPLAKLRADSNTTPALHSLTSAGLAVGIPNADSTASTASPRMKAGASAGSLGGWAGKHYAHTNAGTKVSNTAVVYTNRGAPRSRTPAAAFGANYTASTRVLTGIADSASRDIAGDDFADAGTKTHLPTVTGANVRIPGTYMGAAGTYICDTGAACTSAAGSSGITLTGTWTFVHNVGAMTSEPDGNYLYFGWWLQKDKDGPTTASAFTGVVGSAIEGGGTALASNPNSISGKATYTGGAAGKFAISDPLSGGDAGHFTADATLNAMFGSATTAGLSGTVDNFVANGKDVPWSVSLMRRSWDGTTAGLTTQPAADNPDTSGIDESVVGTVWSIDGNSAAASGTWTAQMYDEKPGNTPPGGDGSNVPTSVTGTFQSHFGSTHTMVGAFGATKE